MVGDLSLATRTEVIGAIRNRYAEASKGDKSRMLDEFVALMGCHRKHTVRLLNQHGQENRERSVPRDKRIYDEAVRQALVVSGRLRCQGRAMREEQPQQLREENGFDSGYTLVKDQVREPRLLHCRLPPLNSMTNSLHSIVMVSYPVRDCTHSTRKGTAQGFP